MQQLLMASYNALNILNKQFNTINKPSRSVNYVYSASYALTTFPLILYDGGFVTSDETSKSKFTVI